MRLAMAGVICATVAAQTTKIENEQVIVRQKDLGSSRGIYDAERTAARGFGIRERLSSPIHFRRTNSEEHKGKAGDYYWHPGGTSGIDNLTDSPAVMIRVQPKCAAAKGHVSNAAVHSSAEGFENDCVRVRRTHLAPGQRSAVSNHPPAVVIHLSATKTKVTFTDGRTAQIDDKPGEVSWDSGGVYSMENLSNEPVEELRVIPKQFSTW